MKILLHICCAQCWSKADNALKNLPDADYTAYWFNPNIHPLIEYRRRLKAVQLIAGRIKRSLITNDHYGLNEFCRDTAANQQIPQRCAICYRMRFTAAARYAKDNGFDGFSSTLCTSLHQSHELIKQIGEECAEQNHTRFFYYDWRESAVNSDEMKGIYKQQYCGCVFSEYDRYKDTSLHLLKDNT